MIDKVNKYYYIILLKIFKLYLVFNVKPLGENVEVSIVKPIYCSSTKLMTFAVLTLTLTSVDIMSSNDLKSRLWLSSHDWRTIESKTNIQTSIFVCHSLEWKSTNLCKLIMLMGENREKKIKS